MWLPVNVKCPLKNFQNSNQSLVQECKSGSQEREARNCVIANPPSRPTNQEVTCFQQSIFSLKDLGDCIGTYHSLEDPFRRR